MRGGRDPPPAFLEPFFERALLDPPWADSTIPSLVYVEEGEIVGFIGSNVRRMRFDGRPITMACSAHQIAHPRVRKRAAGALLMRKYMSGPQDLTITDGATEPVRRMWEGLGGRTVHACCFSYVHVFRPWRLVLGRVAERFGVHRVEPAVAPLAAGLDRATAAVWPGLRRAAPATDVEPLTPRLPPRAAAGYRQDRSLARRLRPVVPRLVVPGARSRAANAVGTRCTAREALGGGGT